MLVNAGSGAIATTAFLNLSIYLYTVLEVWGWGRGGGREDYLPRVGLFRAEGWAKVQEVLHLI